MAKKGNPTEFDRGRRATVALMARLIRATEWDPATRKRLKALIGLCESITLEQPRPPGPTKGASSDAE